MKPTDFYPLQHPSVHLRYDGRYPPHPNMVCELVVFVLIEELTPDSGSKIRPNSVQLSLMLDQDRLVSFEEKNAGCPTSL